MDSDRDCRISSGGSKVVILEILQTPTIDMLCFITADRND